MSKMKFYAAKNETESKIFESWDECKAYIAGKKVQYKGFVTREEAEAWISGKDIAEERLTNDLKKYDGVIYTDGGYDKEVDKYYGAFIVIDKNKKKYPGSLVQASDKFADEKNVAGEILACISAVETAIKLEMKSIIIYYDFAGLELFVNGQWNAKNFTTKFYVEKMSELGQMVEMTFSKVMSHTNDKYNDEVDLMAKTALQSGKGKRCNVGKNMASVSNVSEEDFESICKKINDELKLNVKWNDTLDKNNNKIIRKGSSNGEVITCTLFKSTRTLLLQGKSNTNIFHIFMSYISEMIEDVDIVSILSKAFEFGIDKKKIIEQESAMFIFPDNYPKNIKTLLEQSIANLNYLHEAFDYGMLTFPVLKAMDGHIKYMLSENGILIDDRYECFKKDDSISSASKLQNGKKYVINDEKYFPTCRKYANDTIESCYNFYKNNRDSIFHFGTVMANGIDDTRMVLNVSQAQACINNALDLISNTLK